MPAWYFSSCGNREKEIFAKPSYPWNNPIGFDEEKLSRDVLVRYLLYPSDLENGRHYASNLNWSPVIYHILESLTQKISQSHTGLSIIMIKDQRDSL